MFKSCDLSWIRRNLVSQSSRSRPVWQLYLPPQEEEKSKVSSFLIETADFPLLTFHWLELSCMAKSSFRDIWSMKSLQSSLIFNQNSAIWDKGRTDLGVGEEQPATSSKVCKEHNDY